MEGGSGGRVRSLRRLPTFSERTFQGLMKGRICRGKRFCLGFAYLSEPAPPPVDHVLQRSSQLYLRLPPSAALELLNIACNHRFIRSTHQCSILHYLERHTYKASYFLQQFVNGVNTVASHVVDFARFAVLSG